MIPFLNQIRRIIYVSKDLNRQTDYSFSNQRCYVFIGIGWGAMLAVDAACAILALESPVFCRINAFPLGIIYLCSFVYRQRSMHLIQLFAILVREAAQRVIDKENPK